MVYRNKVHFDKQNSSVKLDWYVGEGILANCNNIPTSKTASHTIRTPSAGNRTKPETVHNSDSTQIPE
jgi:hypothetical protein